VFTPLVELGFDYALKICWISPSIADGGTFFAKASS
jgi:hypothetical protein